MTPQGALIELLTRVGAAQGVAVLINEEELSQWPAAVVATMKSQKLIAKARPATSAICPGCERECVMPVHTPSTRTRSPASFIVCDKRSDINRVAVPASRLEQWQSTSRLIADFVARLLGFNESTSAATDSTQWSIGVLRGKRLRGRVTLLAGDDIKLALAGHTVSLIDVLAIEKSTLTLDKGELIRLVDKPAENAEAEAPERRRERLRVRVREEKARGTKAFLRRVAEEEGISISRLKQLTAEEAAPAGQWAGLTAGQKKGPASKGVKPKH